MSDPIHESLAVVNRICDECSALGSEGRGAWGDRVYELAIALQTALDALHTIDYERRQGIDWFEYAEPWVKQRLEAERAQQKQG